MTAQGPSITGAAPKAVFRVEGVKKDYRMGEVTVSALREVTLEVYEGEFLVILGPSGSGKSTLLNIIGGIDTASAGRVWYRDDELSAYGEAQLTQYRRHHIGFVFQFYNLMPNLTAEENVEMATEISRNPLPAREALRLVNLVERGGHFPSQLSGGEQQRVAIARAVAKQPEILLCDEPTGALDFTTGKVVLDVLNEINRSLGTTVIVITHNASIGDMAHRVVRMMDGHVRDITVNAKRKTASELEW
ncbi:MAG: ABC transporter ATP-binding protein [Candidatus Hydrogenedentes bacterium]|nr:ABC transporter ATP-binding protein [Candidatus Hydrogenedentota bacterium]